MIDFRYHLVSLVSVFLALAVGIVLGSSTPVQQTISSTISSALTNTVEQLRADKAQLTADLATQQTAVKERDSFTEALTPGLVAGRLSGGTVALVVLPGADTDIVKPLQAALQTAGAKVTGRVDVKDSWTDPAQLLTRQTVAGQFQTSLPPATVDAGPDAELAALLARGLVVHGAPTPVTDTDAAAQSALTALAKADLIAVNGTVTARATEVVVLAPAVVQATDVAVAGPTPTASPDTSPTWAVLAKALDDASQGTVVLGPGSAATAGGVIAAVRGKGDTVRVVSTVDTGGTPMGVVGAVYALREQADGGAGSYGFGPGARTPLPATTATSGSTSGSTSTATSSKP